MRVAIVHYWLLGMRGGEQVVEALCGIFPAADIYTLFYDSEKVSAGIRSHKIIASYLNPLKRFYRSLLPLMPSALESFDLREYDLVISSESGPAKGVLTTSTTRHVCYCHTPMRYLWDLYPAYLNEWTKSNIKRALMRPAARRLRLWDYATAARVDQFVANSENVRNRILKSYRRDSIVVSPPVDVDSFYFRPAEDYFLVVSELVAYKRLDTAIDAFVKTGRKLRIVGDGPEYRKLRNRSATNIDFCGRVSNDDLRNLYARCRALVFPGEEDFGMVPVEALSSGKPVIALARGGVLESVPTSDPLGGFLYEKPDPRLLQSAIDRFEAHSESIHPQALQSWAQRFNPGEFRRKIEPILLPQTSK